MKKGVIIAAGTCGAMFLLSAPLMSADARQAAQGRWAEAGDPVARQLIEKERLWATESCVPNTGVAAFIADDFVGTHPKGMIYSKADMSPKPPAPSAAKQERDCKLLSAKVRFYGADVAIIYGSESAVVRSPDGQEATRKLIWTDTVLRRAGRWQVIAVQDMVAPPQ